MFVENNVMQQHRHAGDDMHMNERCVEDHLSNTLFFCKESSIIMLYLLLYIF